MSNFEKSFIFRRQHRRRTVAAVLLILPLLLAALCVLAGELGALAGLASGYLTLLVSLPYWMLACLYLIFPLISAYYSFQLARRGTLHKLHGFNTFVGGVAVILILLEVVVLVVAG